MNKKNLFLILGVVLFFICASYFLSSNETTPVPEIQEPQEPLKVSSETAPSPGTFEQDGKAGTECIEKKLEFPVYHPKDIEEIKKQIYELCIEDVDDIPLLNSVVQTGDAPTKDFWVGGWSSVDDHKEEVNGFKLEPQRDGTFIFYPDEKTTRTYTFFETPKTYTYDPAKKEFYWELDYYGKTISHRARFINDNVLAMMLISGRKVTLDIYQRQPDRHE